MRLDVGSLLAILAASARPYAFLVAGSPAAPRTMVNGSPVTCTSPSAKALKAPRPTGNFLKDSKAQNIYSAKVEVCDLMESDPGLAQDLRDYARQLKMQKDEKERVGSNSFDKAECISDIEESWWVQWLSKSASLPVPMLERVRHKDPNGIQQMVAFALKKHLAFQDPSGV